MRSVLLALFLIGLGTHSGCTAVGRPRVAVGHTVMVAGGENARAGERDRQPGRGQTGTFHPRIQPDRNAPTATGLLSSQGSLLSASEQGAEEASLVDDVRAQSPSWIGGAPTSFIGASISGSPSAFSDRVLTASATASGGDPAERAAGFDQRTESARDVGRGSPGGPSLWPTVRQDVRSLFPSLWEDVRATLTWPNLLILGAAAGVSVAIHQDWDGKVRDYTAEHPDRWGEGSKFLGALGGPSVQLPVLFGTYGYSVAAQNDELHDLMLTMINAYAITTTTTVLIKAAVNTERPTPDWNGGQFGFPSYHTSSSFSFAAVLDEYYGPKVGLPAYALAGLIGWSRIDERDHDLSDVFFGAVLGY
ncbi:MAG TPA: phosphatase PAP2 family protein, partial [Planctomycetaceae bacterium]|nr:phosphatase PAP2 family protein [Planctomycetaceae bacterium]